MNEPQVWTLIGVFAASMVGMITVMTQLMMRTLSAKFDTVNERIDGLRTEMVLRFDSVEGRMDRLENRMDRLENRMDRLETRVERIEKRVDDIDRDVQAISKRVFPK